MAIVYDNAVAFSGTAYTVSNSFTMGDGDGRAIFLDIVMYNVQGLGAGYLASDGKVYMFYPLFSIITGYNYYGEMWYCLDPPAGAGTIYFTANSSVGIYVAAASYLNVYSVNTSRLDYAAGYNTPATRNVTTIAGETIITGCHFRTGTASLSTGTRRAYVWSAIGDQGPVTGTSTAVTWTGNNSHWHHGSIPCSPIPEAKQMYFYRRAKTPGYISRLLPVT